MSELAHPRTSIEDLSAPATLSFEEVTLSDAFINLSPSIHDLLASWHLRGVVDIDEITAELDGLDIEPEEQAVVFDLLDQLGDQVVVPDNDLPQPPSVLSIPNQSNSDGLTADLFDDFKNKVGDHKILSADEEKALARRVEGGDPTAEREFMSHNYKLVMRLSKLYVNKGLDRVDLIQEGAIGLQKAVNKFDWRKGYKFSTYATWWIRQSMQRAVMDKAANIRVPVNVQEHQKKISRISAGWVLETGREPDLYELVEKTGLTPSEIIAARSTPSTVSADKLINEEEGSASLIDFTDSGEHTEESALKNLALEELRRALDALDTEERELLNLRFGLDDDVTVSLENIAKSRKQSKEIIRGMERRALGKLALLLDGKRDLFTDGGKDSAGDTEFAIVDDVGTVEYQARDGAAVSLTVTEDNIMSMLANGHTYESINHSTGLANGRVRKYAQSAYSKLLGGSAEVTERKRQPSAVNSWLLLKYGREAA